MSNPRPTIRKMRLTPKFHIRQCLKCGARMNYGNTWGFKWCRRCTRKYFNALHREYSKRRMPERKRQLYEYWKAWAKKNIERRRAIALRSYHKRKSVAAE